MSALIEQLAALREEAITLTMRMDAREWDLTEWIRNLERAKRWSDTAATDPLSARWLAEDLERALHYRDRYLAAVQREEAA
jgi:hypothetical protein